MVGLQGIAGLGRRERLPRLARGQHLTGVEVLLGLTGELQRHRGGPLRLLAHGLQALSHLATEILQARLARLLSPVVGLEDEFGPLVDLPDLDGIREHDGLVADGRLKALAAFEGSLWASQPRRVRSWGLGAVVAEHVGELPGRVARGSCNPRRSRRPNEGVAAGHAAEVAGGPEVLLEPRLAPLGQGTRGLVVGLVAGFALVEGVLHGRTRIYHDK